MNFVFFSVVSNYNSFHRKREIEVVANKCATSGGKVIYFKAPQFFLKALFFWFKRTKEDSSNTVLIKNLITLLPISLALKSKWLMYPFVTLPIQIQVSMAKRFSFCKDLKVINWFYKPDQYLYLKNSGPYIYLHYDNYQGDETYTFYNASNFEKVLNECIRNSLLTLVCSNKLYTRFVKNYSNVFYYPNAISRNMLSNRMFHSVKDSRNIVIGFIGQLDDTFDFELIKKIAKSSNNYTVILIGPVISPSLNELSQEFDNIKFLGYLDYELLTEQIRTFDIGICPYSPSEFNQYRNPLKILEYFSYGIPVVTVKCDVINGSEGLVGIANNHKHFIELIEAEIIDDNERKRLARKEFAAKNCWDNRISFIFEKLKLKCK